MLGLPAPPPPLSFFLCRRHHFPFLLNASLPPDTLTQNTPHYNNQQTRKQTKTQNNTTKSQQQPGKNLLAAGYVLYSSCTILVLTIGSGVYGFTLDPNVGEYVLTHPLIQIPEVSEGCVCGCVFLFCGGSQSGGVGCFVAPREHTHHSTAQHSTRNTLKLNSNPY